MIIEYICICICIYGSRVLNNTSQLQSYVNLIHIIIVKSLIKRKKETLLYEKLSGKRKRK